MAELLDGRYEAERPFRPAAPTDVVRAVDRRNGQAVSLTAHRLVGPGDEVRSIDRLRQLLHLGPQSGFAVIRDYFVVDDCFVAVADWIEGSSLAEILESHGDPGLPVSTVTRYLAQVADALDRFHAEGALLVEHGDVRSQNLVLRDDGSVLIVGYRLDAGSGAAVRAVDADLRGLAETAIGLFTGWSPGVGEPSWTGVAPYQAKHFSRVLQRALRGEIAARPGACGELIERLRAHWEGDLPVGLVTFCLTDIEGSTTLWEAHPDVMTTVIRRHHDLIADIIESREGRQPKSQGEGDSTLSVFARATDAVGAALAFQRALAAERWPEGIMLKVRMGLHSGEVQQRDGDYYGAAVSRTARIRGLACGGQVLLSNATAQLVADQLPRDAELVAVGERALRGLTRPELIYMIRAPGLVITPPVATTASAAAAVSNTPAFPPALVRSTTPLVGRFGELEWLTGQWDETMDGRRLVLVNGEPGIGKSALVGEFAAGLHAANVPVLAGRCYRENLVPYQPFVEAIGHYIACTPLDQLRARIVAAGTTLERLVPELRRALTDLPEPTRGDPDTERFLLFEAASRFLGGIAGDGRLLLVIEDLHWADAGALALVADVVRSSLPGAVLVVGTWRDREVARGHPLADAFEVLRGERRVEQTTVAGLDSEAVALLVEGHTRQRAPDDVVRVLSAETSGNPFFVEELVRQHAQSAGREDQWFPTLDGQALDLPQGVKDVIRQRLDHLAPETSQLLTTASVIGREFDLETLEEMTGAVEDFLLDRLDEAVEAATITEVSDSVGWYSFSHALVREVLYGELTATRRARLHRRVAGAIEEIAGDDPNRASAIAHHYLLARADPAVSLPHVMHAASVCLDRLAYEEAAGWLERGLEVAPPDDHDARCALLLGLADARRLDDVAGSRAAVLGAAAEARALNDPTRLAEAAARTFRGHVLPAPDSDHEVLALLEEALGQLGSADDALRARLLARLVGESYYTADGADLSEWSAQAVKIARASRDSVALREALISRHHAVHDPDHLEDRLELAREIIEISETAGDVDSMLVGWFLALHDRLEAGDVAGYRTALANCDRLGVLIGDTQTVHWLNAMQATLAGDLEEGERTAQQAFDRGIETNHPMATLSFGIQLFALRWHERRTAELAEAVGGFAAQFPAIPAILAAKAIVQLEANDVDGARATLESLMPDNTLATLRSDYGWLVTLAFAAEVAVGLDDHARIEALYDLVAPYAAQVLVAGAAYACYGSVARTAGNLAAHSGRFAEAERHFEQALRRNRSLDAPLLVARTEAEYEWMRRSRDRAETEGT